MIKIQRTMSILQQCRLIVGVCLSLSVLSGCASNGLFGPRANQTPVQDNGVGVPSFVKNLPKSRSGNMAHYTVFGQRYHVMDSAANFTEQGVASWYGRKFHGRKTSSGEVYDMYAMTAAHKHLPLPTYVRVTNLDNNRSVVVKVNDRGPFVGDRIIDMSFTAAQELDMVEKGTANVRVDALSTHLVEENPDESALNVARAFSKSTEAGSNQAELNQPSGIAPVVVEAQVAAVPLPRTIDASAVLDSGPVADEPATVVNTVDSISVDGSEDGFVELSGSSEGVLSGPNDAAVSEPPELAALMDVPTDTRVSSLTPNTDNVYIQIGAFSQASNAHALIDNVDEQTGLPAYIERDSEQGLFRVKMGPFQQGHILQNTLESLASIGIDSYTKQAVKN